MKKLNYTEEIGLSFHIYDELGLITHPILLHALISEIEEKLRKIHELEG